MNDWGDAQEGKQPRKSQTLREEGGSGEGGWPVPEARERWAGQEGRRRSFGGEPTTSQPTLLVECWYQWKFSKHFSNRSLLYSAKSEI